MPLSLPATGHLTPAAYAQRCGGRDDHGQELALNRERELNYSKDNLLQKPDDNGNDDGSCPSNNTGDTGACRGWLGSSSRRDLSAGSGGGFSTRYPILVARETTCMWRGDRRGRA